MSRTIAESIQQLETSLQDIKSSLDSKLTGGVEINNLKVSDVAGYIDQIETGGGNEIDLSGSFNGVVIVVKTDMTDYTLESVYVNEQIVGSSEYFITNCLNGGDYTVVIMLYPRTKPVTIKLRFYYEESYSSKTITIENIDVSKSKIIFVEKSVW